MPACPPVHTLTQGTTLMQSPYVTFQFSNLVQRLSKKNVGVGSEQTRKREGNLCYLEPTMSQTLHLAFDTHYFIHYSQLFKVSMT